MPGYDAPQWYQRPGICYPCGHPAVSHGGKDRKCWFLLGPFNGDDKAREPRPLCPCQGYRETPERAAADQQSDSAILRDMLLERPGAAEYIPLSSAEKRALRALCRQVLRLIARGEGGT